MSTRTVAIQVGEELFQRIKKHLTKTGLTQKSFLLGVIEKALAETETAEAPAPDTDPDEETTEPEEESEAE